MENIWQLLERGLIGGIVFAAALAGFTGFLYLLYRLIMLTRPKEVQWAERRILSHRFYDVSGRGRVAYLVLCLEQALQFYKQDLTAWDWVLRRLWSITDCSEDDWMDVWLDSVGVLLPSDVLANAPVDRNSALMSSSRSLEVLEAAPADINRARTLYTQAGVAMIVINAIIHNAYSIVGEWGPDTIAPDPDALCHIDEAEETMRAFGVPLPSNESIQPLFKQKDSLLGAPFDGLCLSCLSEKK